MALLSRCALTLALAGGVACGPKLDNEEGGESSSGGTTTGEAPTSSASDPSSPGSSDPTSPASGPGTATSTTSTTGDDPGTAASTVTSATTVNTDTGEPPPVDPPVPCAGEAVPLTDVETLAYLKSQIPPDPNPSGTSGSSGSSGGGEPDPATLYVRLSDQKATCTDPSATLACGPHWEVTIAIPPEFQAPGLFNLLGQDVQGSGSETGPDDGNNMCSFGGGSFPATFEILAIDDATVTGRLCDVKSLFSVDVALEGSFVAPRC